MAKYEELIDDFELEKRIKTIPEDMDLTEYIKQRGGVDYPEEKADGGAIGIEVLFSPKTKDLQGGGPAGGDGILRRRRSGELCDRLKGGGWFGGSGVFSTGLERSGAEA